MSRICPLLNERVVYLVCAECDKKTKIKCKNGLLEEEKENEKKEINPISASLEIQEDQNPSQQGML